MPDVSQREQICWLCHRRSVQTHYKPPATYESPDLDGRPPGAQRQAVRYQLEECPHCGYTAPSLEHPSALHREALWEALERISQTDDPEFVKRFVKYGWLCEQTGALEKAARQLVCAAWECDDIGDEPRAAFWRAGALGLLRRSLRQELLGAHMGDLLCLQADLLRRCGRFDDVLALTPPTAVLLSRLQHGLLGYQKELAQKRDGTAHLMEEISDYRPRASGMSYRL